MDATRFEVCSFLDGIEKSTQGEREVSGDSERLPTMPTRDAQERDREHEIGDRDAVKHVRAGD